MIEFQLSYPPYRETLSYLSAQPPTLFHLVDSFSFVTEPAHFEKCFNNLAITHLPHKAGFVLHTYNLPGRGMNNPKQGVSRELSIIKLCIANENICLTSARATPPFTPPGQTHLDAFISVSGYQRQLPLLRQRRVASHMALHVEN